MDETPPPSSSSTPRAGPLEKSHRQSVEYGGAAEPIECTCKSCQSCTAGLIADCFAVCCCPCAVVNILLFTFLKIPYMIGRKWVKKGKKRIRGGLEKKRSNGDRVKDNGSSKNEKVCEEALEIVEMEFVDEEGKGNFSARVAAEQVWLELYQNGHLGFGRVSFTGIPSEGNAHMPNQNT